jgi:Uma2 family endonuclease
MTRREFHRRYLLRPDLKAELVEGVVYVASPVRYEQHDKQAAFVRGWLFAYAAKHPAVELGNDATLILDNDNEVQPDAFLFLRDDPASPKPNEAGFLVGAPQLVVEVAGSSMSRDVGDKLRSYRRNGVREYIIWRVEDGAIDWFRLIDGEYEAIPAGPDGVVESTTLPGLRLDARALLTLDAAAVLAALAR